MAGRKQTATMELAIGATIIAGVIILIVMLMAWGNTSSILGRHYRVVVNMANVGGLKEGAPVKMGGFQIGRVASIQIRPGGTDMEIVLDIDESQLLPRDSTAKVSTAGLVGDAFMEILPGKSAETIKRASTVAEAERIEAGPLPDMSEILVKVNQFGDQLITLTANINDIVGDVQFRRNVKSLTTNIDAVSYQANLILQRSQNVVDNIERASQNVAVLTDALKDSAEKITGDVEKISDTVLRMAGQARDAIGNLDGGITDARRAINSTLGDAGFAADLSQAVANINAITDNIAKRRDAIDRLLGNLGAVSEDVKSVAHRVREITDRVEPKVVAETLEALTGAIASMTEVVDRIKAEPVLALSVNKAADRIVKMKFDEMSKRPDFRGADATLREINRWIREASRRGYMQDPAYEYGDRPYVVDR